MKKDFENSSRIGKIYKEEAIKFMGIKEQISHSKVNMIVISKEFWAINEEENDSEAPQVF